MSAPFARLSGHAIRMRAGILLLLLLLQSLFLLLYGGPGEPIERFVVISIAGSGVGIAVWLLLRGDRRTKGLPHAGWWILGAGMILRVSLVGVPPIASDDYHRYIWDGRVQAHGIDPYRHPPSDPSLAHLRTAELPDRINHPEMRTLYPPGAEWLFLIAYLVGGDQILFWKILMLAAEGMTLLFLLLALRAARLPEDGLALYALAPIPILHFMVDLHVDGFAIPFFALSLWLWERGRRTGASWGVAGAAAVKLFPLAFIPAFSLSSKGRSRGWAIFIPLAVVGSLYLPYLIGGSRPFEGLAIFSENWEANSSLFRILYEGIGNNQVAHRITTGATVILLAAIAVTRLPLREKVYWSAVGFFLLAPTVHPWYLSWIACVLPLVPGWEGIAFVALGNLAGITVIGYRLTGVWEQSVGVLLLEYVPIAALLLLRIARRTRGA